MSSTDKSGYKNDGFERDEFKNGRWMSCSDLASVCSVDRKCHQTDRTRNKWDTSGTQTHTDMSHLDQFYSRWSLSLSEVKSPISRVSS